MNIEVLLLEPFSGLAEFPVWFAADEAWTNEAIVV